MDSTEKDFSALTKAIEFGHLDVATYLLGHKIELKGDELHIAAENGHLELVRYLIDTVGIPVNRNSVRLSGHPIHCASRQGHANIVKELLNKQADIEAKSTDNQQTALHIASANGHLGVVRLLLSRNAHIEALDSNQRTPLFRAIEMGKSSIIQFLIERKANLNATDINGNSLLAVSCLTGNLELVRTLQKHGVDIKKASGAVLAACRGKHLEIVQYLSENGASLDDVDKGCQSAVHYAAKYGFHEIVKYLTENDVKLETKANDGTTALMQAVAKKNYDIALLLINCGANIEAIKKSAVVKKAISHGHFKFASFLISEGTKIDWSQQDASTALLACCKDE